LHTKTALTIEKDANSLNRIFLLYRYDIVITHTSHTT